MEQKQERRRGRYQRSRRGPDRQGGDQRSQQTQGQAKPARDAVDVEQIMRDIRSRIAQRQGVDLSTQEIQDLAARRLESILDPRAIKPSLLNALRRSAGEAPARPSSQASDELAFTFEDSTIYDSHRGALRLMRRLLNPLLKLFFNPNPVIGALHKQARLNVQRAERDADRDREQTEWNALHYEIVQRLVTEVSRVSLELKSMAMHIESLDAKLEFNEQRVRSIEGSAHRARPQSRPVVAVVAVEPVVPVAPVAAAVPEPSRTDTSSSGSATAGVDVRPPDPLKRRRRRRRGRRPDAPSGEATQIDGTSLVGEPETRTSEAPQVPSTNPEETPTMGPLPSSADDGSAATVRGPVVHPPTVEPLGQAREMPAATSTVTTDSRPVADTAGQTGDVTPALPADTRDAGLGEP
jgi:hypothetical protein